MGTNMEKRRSESDAVDIGAVIVPLGLGGGGLWNRRIYELIEMMMNMMSSLATICPSSFGSYMSSRSTPLPKRFLLAIP